MKIEKKHILIGLAAALGIYLAANAIYNHFLSEKQKIKNLFYQMESDIEEKSVLGFGDYFTKDAKITYREFDITRGQIGPFLWRILKNYGELKVTFDELTVELKGDQAVVTFAGDAVDTKKRTRGSFEGTAKLRKEEGEWKLYNAVGRERRKPKLIF